MPRKLRYTEALDLNARGLEKEKRKAKEAKRIAASQVPLTFFDKGPKPKKVKDSKNHYWDAYNGVMQRFNQTGLTEFLSYQCQKTNQFLNKTMSYQQRKDLLNKLRQELIKIEKFKYRFSVAVASKEALKLICTLCHGRSLIQILTSNHECSGYWAFLLSQKNVNVSLYRAPNSLLENNNNNNTNNTNTNNTNTNSTNTTNNGNSQTNNNNNNNNSAISMTRKKMSNKQNNIPKYKMEKFKKELVNQQQELIHKKKIDDYKQWFTVQNEFNLYDNNKNNKQNQQTSIDTILNGNKHTNNNNNNNNNNNKKKNNGYDVMLLIYPDYKQDMSFIDNPKNVNNNNNNHNNNNNDNNQHANVQCFGSLLRASKDNNNKNNNNNNNNNNSQPLPSVQCLKHFNGTFIVHVGELFGATSCMNPWGRTTSMEFQIALNKKYHKIYEIELPHWPMMRDTLSIWKRNEIQKIGNELIVSIKNDEINDTYQTNYVNTMIKKYNISKNVNKKNMKTIYGDKVVDTNSNDDDNKKKNKNKNKSKMQQKQ